MVESKFVKPKFKKRGFVKIKCKDCSNEQYVFYRVSSNVICNVCGSTLAKPTGGSLETNGEVIEE